MQNLFIKERRKSLLGMHSVSFLLLLPVTPIGVASPSKDGIVPWVHSLGPTRVGTLTPLEDFA
jgi:hypothetical protein